MNPTIAIEGEHFVLSLPASHTIRIPLNEPDRLVTILMARQRGAIKIAEPGSPTQWQVNRATELAAIDTFRANALSDLGL